MFSEVFKMQNLHALLGTTKNVPQNERKSCVSNHVCHKRLLSGAYGDLLELKTNNLIESEQ